MDREQSCQEAWRAVREAQWTKLRAAKATAPRSRPKKLWSRLLIGDLFRGYIGLDDPLIGSSRLNHILWIVGPYKDGHRFYIRTLRGPIHCTSYYEASARILMRDLRRVLVKGTTGT